MQTYAIMVFLLIVLCTWYFISTNGLRHASQETQVVKEEFIEIASKQQAFIPATEFQGIRPGYVYKMDVDGLGYYLDD